MKIGGVDVMIAIFCSNLNNKRQCFRNIFGEKSFKIIISIPGANPKTVINNAGVVKIYSATNSMARFKIKMFFPDLKTL
jgi:hypothetical protein